MGFYENVSGHALMPAAPAGLELFRKLGRHRQGLQSQSCPAAPGRGPSLGPQYAASSCFFVTIKSGFAARR